MIGTETSDDSYFVQSNKAEKSNYKLGVMGSNIIR